MQTLDWKKRRVVEDIGVAILYHRRDRTETYRVTERWIKGELRQYWALWHKPCGTGHYWAIISRHKTESAAQAACEQHKRKEPS